MRAARVVPSAACPAVPARATVRTASAVEVLVSTLAAASSVRRNRSHWPGTCGWVITVSMSPSGISRAAISECLILSIASPAISTLSPPRASRSSVTLTEPSIEFSIGTTDQSTLPPRERHDRLVDGRERDGLDGVRRCARQERLLAEGALGAEVADARARGRRLRRRAHPRRRGWAPLQRRGGQPRPPRGRAPVPPSRPNLLAVDACLVAVMDARQHDPRPVFVEERDRHRLPPGELVVGVIAHESAPRDRSAQGALGAPHPCVEAHRGGVHVFAEGVERRVQRRGMFDEVALAELTQHHALGVAKTPDGHAENDAPDQRERSDRGGRDRDDALGVGDRAGHCHKLAVGGDRPARGPPGLRAIPRRSPGTSSCCFRFPSRPGRAPRRLRSATRHPSGCR